MDKRLESYTYGEASPKSILVVTSRTIIFLSPGEILGAAHIFTSDILYVQWAVAEIYKMFLCVYSLNIFGSGDARTSYPQYTENV